MTISADVVLASHNESDPDPNHNLYTILCRYPRFIHCEMLTHRNFSRSAASSRAIPVEKLIEDVLADPAIPIVWHKNRRGMQGIEECNEQTVEFRETTFLRTREEEWYDAMTNAVQTARRYEDAGYHKQIVNRLLEPFAHITVLISATEWDNFFKLRDHEDAEPHIQILARQIKAAIASADVQIVREGGWHLPFITPAHKKIYNLETLQKLSVAMCASTSYKTVDGYDMTVERALAIYDKLITSKPEHASPMEHVARADRWAYEWLSEKKHANFRGWIQLRHARHETE